MKRPSILLMGVLVTVLAAACGAQTEAERSVSTEPRVTSVASAAGGDDDALMAQARALAARTTDLEGQLWEGHLMTALIATDAAAARPELATAKALLKEMAANEKSIIGLLEQIERLDVSRELRTYAGQQKEIAELRLLGMTGVGDLLARIETRFREKGRLSQADIEKLFAEAETSGVDGPLAHLEEKGQASRDFFKQSGLPQRYYINNGLGEAYDAPAGQTEEEAGAFSLADDIRFEGPMVSEEAPPRRIWGSFETTIAEAMQAERAALESGGWTVSARSAGGTRGVMTARNAFWEATLTFERAGGNAGAFSVRLTQM